MATYPRRNKANSVVRLLTRIRRARSDPLSSSNLQKMVAKLHTAVTLHYIASG